MSDTPELDIVEVILRACLDAGMAQEAALRIEGNIRIQFGGQRVRIPKKQKHLTPELRQAVFQDGLTSVPDSVITAKYKISRATLHRLMKTGG
jgi:azurin